MTLSVVEIYNHALGAAGTRTSLSNVNENTREAELCNQFYPTVREQVFAAAHWATGKRAQRLALLMERTDDEWTSVEPMPPWSFAYALPAGCLRPRFLTDYAPFEVNRYLTANAISSHAEDPILVYSAVEETTALWDIGLTTAVFTALAAMIAPSLTGSTRKVQSLLQEANRQIMIGREQAANGDFLHYEAMPDWLVARGISGPQAPNRYIYPVGPLFTGSTA